jgi:hypothetical protein
MMPKLEGKVPSITTWPGTPTPLASVTVTVTVLVEIPPAGIDVGDSWTVTLVGGPAADASPVLAPNETSSATAPITKGRTAAI